jgi:hypothetical protein
MRASAPLDPRRTMTGHTDTSARSDRSVPDRRSHSARIAMIALHRRDDAGIDRDAARRLTVARLHRVML